MELEVDALAAGAAGVALDRAEVRRLAALDLAALGVAPVAEEADVAPGEADDVALQRILGRLQAGHRQVQPDARPVAVDALGARLAVAPGDEVTAPGLR